MITPPLYLAWEREPGLGVPTQNGPHGTKELHRNPRAKGTLRSLIGVIRESICLHYIQVDSLLRKLFLFVRAGFQNPAAIESYSCRWPLGTHACAIVFDLAKLFKYQMVNLFNTYLTQQCDDSWLKHKMIFCEKSMRDIKSRILLYIINLAYAYIIHKVNK